MMWLVDTQCVMRISWEPQGTATDVGTVVVTVTRGDGTTLVTDAATTNNADGTYDYTLTPANNSQVDRLRFDWKRSSNNEIVTTYEDIVGGFLFTESEARAFDDQVLADAATYTDQDIIEARDRATTIFEDYCHRSFVPRFGRVKAATPRYTPRELALQESIRLEGGAGYWHDLIEVLSATDAAGSVTTSNIVVGAQTLYRTDNAWSGNVGGGNPWPVVVNYSYGLSRPPADIRHAALILARYELVVKDVSDRMISFADPNVGTVRLSTPGRDYPTGIPVVDEILNRHRVWLSV